MRSRLLSSLAVVVVAALSPVRGSEGLRVSPAEVVLDRPEASQQLLVNHASDVNADLTHSVKYESANPDIASVTQSGRVLPLTEGQTQITIRDDSRGGNSIITVPVTVRDFVKPAPLSFHNDVIPILSKAGCNSGGCHGKAEGQNGFKLSIFGFDPLADYEALISESRGRRVSVSSPEASLLLKKGIAQMPHGGGAKIPEGGLWHRRLARWIREGARRDEPGTHSIASIEVEPQQITMSPGATQQLRVTAVDQDDVRRCVTVEAEYHSNAEPIATADHSGLIRVSGIPGEAAILVRYMGHVGVCRVTLPQSDIDFKRPPENNFVDRHAWNKLDGLRIQPSELADDATFLRRVYLDTIGTLPTVAEARAFLDDADPEKRAKLIDRLFERDEYADYHATRWADILRVDKDRVTPQGAVAMTRWLRQQFKDNTPYDRFVRDIVTARGNTLAETAAAFYQVHNKPEHAARSVSQVFLGVRIECAQCHHHPFERWGQSDYFAFSGFFTGIGRKGSLGGGQKIFSQAGKDLQHPRTKETVATAGLGAVPAELPEGTDRRQVLADWMTSPDNPFLARMIVNRLWAHYFGRGLVEPIDDMRATNPATNEPLLDELSKFVIDNRFDQRALTRVMLNSRLYQLSAVPNDTNELDDQNFSRAAWKAMPAEVLLDAFCQATEIPEKFNGWPEGYRAIQVWDNRHPAYFFRVFGKPQRVSVCECERGNEPSIAQALHLMNSEESVRKIRHRDGRAARLAGSQLTDDQLIEELFLATLARRPSDKEVALMRQAFEESSGNRRAATEDVLWTLLNTREFVYNH